MASHLGSEGTVKIGSDTVAEIQSWNFVENATMVNTTSNGDSAETFVAGTSNWSGSLECFWDETDTAGQGALTKGASVTLNLYPEGATTGDTYWTGTALVQSISRNIGDNNTVTSVSFSFQGTGALTEGTVA